MKLLMPIVLLFSIAGCMSNKESQRTGVPTSGRTVDRYVVGDCTVAAVSDNTVNQIDTNDTTSLLVFVWLIVAVMSTVCITLIVNRICTPKKKIDHVI
jgi:hypothetical protein